MVDILLSLYNGSPFIEEFILSLKEQTFQRFNLIINDDCSSDGSLQCAVRTCNRCGISCRTLPVLNSQIGIVKSYDRLIKSSAARYTMFADQDDVWHPDKIEKTLNAMLTTEKSAGPDLPCLIHTDLSVCDQSMREIHPSMVRFVHLDPGRNSLKQLIVQNCVTGCTVMFNRALKNLIGTFPDHAICHDWYVAIIAAAFGKIYFLPESTINYRQHTDNYYGAVDLKQELLHGIHRDALRRRLLLAQEQTADFIAQYAHLLNTSQMHCLSAWSNCRHEKSRLKRVLTLIRYGFRKGDLIRTLGMWWAI